MSIKEPNRREVLASLFAATTTASALPNMAFAGENTPENPWAKNPNTFDYDHVPENPWPDPRMRQMFIDSNSADNESYHSSEENSLNHIHYYDSDINFSGTHYSDVPEIDEIDNFLINGKWGDAYTAADSFIREGGLYSINDDALLIRILSTLVVALRYDGEKYFTEIPGKRFPFDDDIARELQYYIYNLSNSPLILEQIFPPELDQALLEMTKPKGKFHQQYTRIKELERIGNNLTEEQATEKYELAKSLIQQISDTMNSVYDTKPTPFILDSIPSSFSNLGVFVPVNTDIETNTEFDQLAAKHLGENFIFISYSDQIIDEMLKSFAHEKLHAVQSAYVRDLEAGNIPDNSALFPLAQLYALNESLYSLPDPIACNQNLYNRCDQTIDEYTAQPWEANAYSLDDIFGRVLQRMTFQSGNPFVKEPPSIRP